MEFDDFQEHLEKRLDAMTAERDELRERVRWRKTSEEMPRHRDGLLASYGRAYIIVIYDPAMENGWFSKDGIGILPPDHWQPLPEPPA